MANHRRNVPCETCRLKKLACKMVNGGERMQCERCIRKNLECPGPQRTDAYRERQARKESEGKVRTTAAAPSTLIIPSHIHSDYNVGSSFGPGTTSPLSPASSQGYPSFSPTATYMPPTNHGSSPSHYSMSPYSHSPPYQLQAHPQQDRFIPGNGAVPQSFPQRLGESYPQQTTYAADGNMYTSGYNHNPYMHQGSFNVYRQ